MGTAQTPSVDAVLVQGRDVVVQRFEENCVNAKPEKTLYNCEVSLNDALFKRQSDKDASSIKRKRR